MWSKFLDMFNCSTCNLDEIDTVQEDFQLRQSGNKVIKLKKSSLF